MAYEGTGPYFPWAGAAGDGATSYLLQNTDPGATDNLTRTPSITTSGVGDYRMTPYTTGVKVTYTTTAQDLGWNMKASNTDGPSGARRRVAAGTWGLDGGVGIVSGTGFPVGGNVTVRINVYARQVTGGTFRYLGTLTDSSVVPIALQTVLWTTTGSLPEVILAAGETLQVEVWYTAPNASLTNYVLSHVTGTAYDLTLPGAGLRYLFDRSLSDAAPASESLTRTKFAPRDLSDSASAADAVARVIINNRTTADNAFASDTVTRAALFPRAGSDTAPASDAVTRRTTQARSTTDAAPATEAPTRLTIQARAVSDAAPATEVATRQTVQARSLADTALASDALSRQTTQARSTSDAAPAVDAVTRQTVQARSLADAAPATDAVTRRTTQARSTTDAASATDAVTRTAYRFRATSDSAPATDAVTRSATQARSLSDSASASDAVTRILIQVRGLADNIGPNATDFPIQFGTRNLSGVTRDSAGVVVGGMTVKLFRQDDDRVVQTMTSDAVTGIYSFVRDQFDFTDYYVLSYGLDGSEQIHGVSDRGLRAALT